MRIWEHWLAKDPPPSTLPAIIPVIIHHSETGWTATTKFHELFGPTVAVDNVLARLTPGFEVVVDDVSFASDQEIRHRGLSPRAMLGLVFLRDGRREGRILDELEDWVVEIRALLATPDGQRAIRQLFSYLFRVTPNLDRSDLEEKVRRIIPETEELVMTLAEQLIQQGLSQGLSQGKRVVLRRQLELKYGDLPADTISRLDAADESALERYAERFVTATSLSEVLGN